MPLEARRAARDLFLEGNRLFRVPLFAQAAEKYTTALGKWKHPAFYFNLALAQLNLDQEVDAHDNLAHALEHGEGALAPDELHEAQNQLRDVERQLGRIHIACQTPGAEVTLDGATLFIAPGSYRGWAKAKPHELTAKKDGYLAQARRVAVSPGTSQDIDLELITLSEAADTGRRWATWKPWSVVAAGVAVAAAAGVLHALAARNFDAHDDALQKLSCSTMQDPMFPGCPANEIPQSLKDQLSRARQQQNIAVAGYITGGAVIAAGAVLTFLNQPHLPEQGAANARTSGVAIAPAVSGDMLGITVSVTR